jgi:hypothetical protein
MARDVARIVTEFERKVSDEGNETIPMSYTTLVRKKSKYKYILQVAFDGKSTYEIEKTDQENQLEELKLYCVHIEHQNELLRNRLDSLGDKQDLQAASKGQEGREASEDIEMLIDFIDALIASGRDLFTTIYLTTIDEDYPDPGLYGADDSMVAEYETLERLQELRNGLK